MYIDNPQWEFHNTTVVFGKILPSSIVKNKLEQNESKHTEVS